MTALLVGKKCSHTGSMLRFFVSLRLVLEQKIYFLEVPLWICKSVTQKKQS